MEAFMTDAFSKSAVASVFQGIADAKLRNALGVGYINGVYEAYLRAKCSYHLWQAAFNQSIIAQRMVNNAEHWGDLRAKCRSRYIEDLEILASTPTHDRTDIWYKKDAIGRCWLKAAGVEYDFYRAAIALDEARFPKRKVVLAKTKREAGNVVPSDRRAQ
jgi:hypothetical protein